MEDLGGLVDERRKGSAAQARAPQRLRSSQVAAVLAIATLLVVGYALSRDYGVSWDEPDNAVFGQQALQAYGSLRPPAEWYSSLEPYGPFFAATAEGITRSLLQFRPVWVEAEARHFAYFLAFPLSAAALYGLVRRIVSPLAALTCTLLLVSQPLLFGHAFINPKDTPFMAFFTAAVWSGLWMLEAVGHPVGGGDRDLAKPALFRAAAGSAILGLSTSIRLFAPFAGVLVSAWALVQVGRKSLTSLVRYWATAAVVSYLTWPYLWGEPVRRLRESLLVMLNFPWDNLVLYRGLAYPAPALPWHYLPFTTLIQLTEPLVAAAVLGFAIGLVGMVKDPRRIPLYVMFGLWAALPYAVAVIGDVTVYDNSRQFLFAIPPMFLSAALAFEALLRRVRPVLARVGIIGAALAPGLGAIGQLHPFEYVYYNALVGGVQGAYRQYELDYWGTSYREAMEYVNGVAPIGATVQGTDPWMSAAIFARLDLVMARSGRSLPAGAPPPSYFLTLTRSNLDQGFMPEVPVLLEVRVAGATLALVKGSQAIP